MIGRSGNDRVSAERIACWELVLLLGDPQTIAAGRNWHRRVGLWSSLPVVNKLMAWTTEPSMTTSTPTVRASTSPHGKTSAYGPATSRLVAGGSSTSLAT
jgi:hypothetical protein